MSTDFHLPELGENVESGDVVKLLVSEGDQLVRNQSVIELETDKAVVEIPCPLAGEVTKIHVRKGDTVKVGQVLLTVEEEEGAAADEAARPMGTEAAAGGAAEGPAEARPTQAPAA
ncbi:MAG TPA: biotin/lipoyl-binding protein, partial [Planctomycetes bacterium]|nr:biotin/lipoyl-binding protein [Planctomycetota bacterium]